MNLKDKLAVKNGQEPSEEGQDSQGRKKEKPSPQNPHQVIELLGPQIARALPNSGLSADRMARIALTEVRRIPDLQYSDLDTFAGALLNCVQLGLEPGGAAGEAYLLPFFNRDRGIHEVQLVIGYKGMVKLFWQHPLAAGLDMQVVREKDAFEYEYGTQRYLRHKPAPHPRGPVTYYYAVAHLTNSGFNFRVMQPHDVEEVRSRARSKDKGPWRTDYQAMAMKTVLRQLFKLMPKSAELSRALSHDGAVRTDLTAAGIDAAPQFADIPEMPDGPVDTPGQDQQEPEPPTEPTGSEWGDPYGADQT